MGSALAGVRQHTPLQPPGLVQVRIDSKTGEAVASGAEGALFEVFREEYAPRATPGESKVPRPEEIF